METHTVSHLGEFEMINLVPKINAGTLAPSNFTWICIKEHSISFYQWLLCLNRLLHIVQLNLVGPIFVHRGTEAGFGKIM